MKKLKYVLVLLVLAACSQPPAQRTPIELEVDPAVSPADATLPGFEDGEPRPVAVVTGDDGAVAEFVANELWLQSSDKAELDAFVARWHGTVLRTFDPADYGLSGVETQFLVRVDVSAADTARLAEDLRALDDRATGSYKVSSQAGLELIAAASAEAAGGLDVGMNWVGAGGGFRSKSSLEAPSGNPIGGVAYNQNAFGWPSHDVGSPQDIGVAEAWRALDLAGKLGNRVKLAVLDMGFGPDQDWRGGYLAIANVPLVQPTGTENLLSCSGGAGCPWHGTEVFSAAMALSDNQYGGAGPAGPVAEPIVVFTLYDFFTSITALGEARIAGAKIANMSYSAPVPWYLGWSVLPFEAATAAFRASGMLLFAAAGNEGKNVDGEGCTFGVCWERTWYTPCENAGVICVGGLAGNSTSKAAGSNYGGDQVDIFGPFTLWLGPDPGDPENRARALSGTSFSSPFVAGVAALVWAADPGLDADDVEDILMETAHANADSRVKRHVNALAAVGAALGNVPPSLGFRTLEDGAELPLNLSLTLEAEVDDFEDGRNCCAIRWSSSVDGDLGEGASIEHAFTTEGDRILTISTVDSQGAGAEASVRVSVVNDPPRVHLERPLAGEEPFRGQPFILRGRAEDFNEQGGRLACERLVWTSSNAADPLPQAGCEVQVSFASSGDRTLTLTATDLQGASDAASVDIGVVEPPANLPPFVHVTSPEDHANLPTDQPITLSGMATDPEGATGLTTRWTVQLGEEAPTQVGTALSTEWTPADTYDFSGEGNYVIRIRLEATDPQGNQGADFVTLEFLVIK